MHELSIAASIVQYSLSEANKNKASRVAEMHVEVGELMQVETDVLSEALNHMMTGPRLVGAKVKVSVRSASFTCGKCGARWGMDEAKKQLSGVPRSLLVQEPDSKEVPLHFLPHLYPAFVHCPKCESSDVSVTDGQDVLLTRLVLE
jgi:hydrogenase nickel incorporation protein HypA/HybF